MKSHKLLFCLLLALLCGAARGQEEIPAPPPDAPAAAAREMTFPEKVDYGIGLLNDTEDAKAMFDGLMALHSLVRECFNSTPEVANAQLQILEDKGVLSLVFERAKGNRDENFRYRAPTVVGNTRKLYTMANRDFPDETAVAKLVGMLDDECLPVRYEAAMALVECGDAAKAAHDKLLELFNDTSLPLDIRGGASIALQETGVSIEKYLPVALPILTRKGIPDFRPKIAIFDVLATQRYEAASEECFGDQTADVVDALQACLQLEGEGDNPHVLKGVMQLAAKLNLRMPGVQIEQPFVDKAIAALSSEDPGVVQWGVLLCGKLGSRATPAIRKLSEHTQAGSLALRIESLRAMGYIAEASCGELEDAQIVGLVNFFTSFTASDSASIREEAGRSLCTMNDARGRKAMERHLATYLKVFRTDGNQNVRRSFTYVLLLCAPPGTLDDELPLAMARESGDRARHGLNYAQGVMTNLRRAIPTDQPESAKP